MIARKLWFKTLCAVLAFTLTYLDLVWAADVRQMIVDAKKSFETWDDDKRLGGMPAQQQTTAEAANQSAVDQQNNLQQLGNLNFSLTTKNGDIIRYLGNSIQSIERADGTLLSNVTLDENGAITGADLRLVDGSLQVFRGGQLLGYERPDGSIAFYENGRLAKVVTPQGLETLYRYVQDADGRIIETVLENIDAAAFYDSEGRITKLLSKRNGNLSVYEEAKLKSITRADGTELRFMSIALGEASEQIVFEGLFDASGALIQSDAAGLEAEIPFEHAVYNGGKLREIRTLNGDLIRFADSGFIESMTDAGGKSVTFAFEDSALSNIVSTQIIQDGVESRYDEKGNLSSFTVDGLTVHYKDGTQDVDWLEREDGTELHRLVYDAGGALVGAEIYDPDGNVRFYENGLLKKFISKDEAVYEFFDEKLLKLTTPEKLVYHFVHTPEKIVARLDSSIIPDAMTAIEMEYDAGMSLKKMLRKNSDILSFLDNELVRYEATGSSPQEFFYEKDASGRVVQTKVVQGSAETIYDAANQPLKTTLAPTPGNPATLEVMYKYGKIREVLKDGVSTLKYSYEILPGGKEKTLIEDLEEKASKVYIDGQLLTQLSKETNVLSEYSYSGGRVSAVKVSRFGRALHDYAYSYEGQNTIVRDELGVVRTYDAAQKLAFLEKENAKYRYSYHSQDGTEIVEENLIEKTLPGGVKVRYQNGDISSIELADGAVMNDVVLDGSRGLARATIALAGGVKKIFGPQGVTEEIRADGTHLYFESGKLVKYVYPGGDEVLFVHEGNSIKVRIGNLTFHYAPSGGLTGFTSGAGDYYAIGEAIGAGTPTAQIAQVLSLAVEAEDFALADNYELQAANRAERLAEEAGLARRQRLASGPYASFTPPYEFTPEFIASHGRLPGETRGWRYEYSGQWLPQYGTQAHGVWFYTGPSTSSQKVFVTMNQLVGYEEIPYPDLYIPPTESLMTTLVDDGGSMPQSYSLSNRSFTYGTTWQKMPREIFWKTSTNVSDLPRGQWLYVRAHLGAIQTGWCDPGWGTSCTVSTQYMLGQNITSYGLASYNSNQRMFFGMAENEEAIAQIDAELISIQSQADGIRARRQVILDRILALETSPSFAETRTDVKTLPFASGIHESTPASSLASWKSAVTASVLDVQTLIAQEYSADGVMETQSRADKTTTLFDEGRPSLVVDEDGSALIEYSYDSDGNLARVHLKHAREALPDEIQSARTRIEEEKRKELLKLAEAKSLAVAGIKAQADEARAVLRAQMQSVGGQMSSLEGRNMKGKAAKKAKSQALDQIRGVQNQLWGQWDELHRQESEGYAQLDGQVMELSNRIEQESEQAFAALAEQEKDFKKEILRQEVSPVIYDIYRRILGRDPSSAEYDSWIGKLDYESGEIIVNEQLIENTTPGVSTYFDGAGDILSIPDSDDWNLGSGDFTIDTWVNFQSFKGGAFVQQGNTASNRWWFGYADGQLGFLEKSGGALHFNMGVPWNPQAGVWHHVALSREGNNWRFFANGQLVGTVDASGSIANFSNPLTVGTRFDGGVTFYFNGWLDGLRIRKGIAKYKQAFTPQTVFEASDAQTVLLLKADTDNPALLKDVSSKAHSVAFVGNAANDASKYKLVGKSYTRVFEKERLVKAVTDFVNALPELAQRKAYVESIKTRVSTSLQEYLQKPSSDQAAYLEALGLGQADAIPLSPSDAEKVLRWLNSRSLHFGQSAFLSLESLLDQKGIHYAREDIAFKAIMIDILAGIITPLDDGDLVLSVFSLNKVASLYGLNLAAAKLSWNDLKTLYDNNRVVIGEEEYETIVDGSSIAMSDGRGRVLVPDSSDWDLLDSSHTTWTVEFWAKHDTLSTGQQYLSHFPEPYNRWTMSYWGNAIHFAAETGGNQIMSVDTGAVITDTGWHHIAFMREGNQYYIYVDGRKRTQQTVNVNVQFNAALSVGAINWNGGIEGLRGKMDGLRISHGVRRYQADFAPSAFRFAADASTKLLMYSDAGQIKDFSSAARTLQIAGLVAVNTQTHAQKIKTISTRKVIKQLPSYMDISALTESEKADIIANPDKYGPRVIAHINGNHFVVITNVTNDTITYIDSGIGEDKKNEVLTVSRTGFEKIWKGDVTLERARVESAGLTSKVLSVSEARAIRGAFFGSILNLIGFAITIFSGGVLTPFAAMFYAMGAVVSVLEGDFISAISSVVTLGLGGGFGLLGDVFKGAFPVFSGLIDGVTNVFSTIYTAVTGFFDPIAKALGGFAASFGEIGGKIVQNVIQLGVSYGVSKGLELIGVDPQISGFAGSLVAGAIVGGMNPGVDSKGVEITRVQAIRTNVMETVTLNSVGRLGMELDLDPRLTQVLSAGLNLIYGGTVDGDELGAVFENIKPELIASLSTYGFQALGSRFGLSDRMSTIIGSAFASGISEAFQGGTGTGQRIIQSVNDGLTGAALQLGLDFAIDEMDINDPLLEALSSAVLTQTIASFLDPNGNLIDDLLEKAATFSEEFTGTISSTDFYRHAAEHGYESAMETYATSIFSRLATEEIIKAGGIAQIISGRAELIDYNGVTLTKIKVTNTDGFIMDGSGAFVGMFREVAGVREEMLGQFEFNSNRSRLINGTVRQQYENGAVSYIEVRDGIAYRAVLRRGRSTADATSVPTVTILPCAFSESGCPDFDVREGRDYEPIWDLEIIENYDGRMTISSSGIENALISIAGETSYNVSASRVNTIEVDVDGVTEDDSSLNEDLYILANGILNDESKEGGSPQYLLNLKEDLLRFGESISYYDVIAAPTFFQASSDSLLDEVAENVDYAESIHESIQDYLKGIVRSGGMLTRAMKIGVGKIIENLFMLAANAGKDILGWIKETADSASASWLVNEIKSAAEAFLSIIGVESRSRNTIAVGYSGGFLPLVEAFALNPYSPDNASGYNVKTLVSLGGATINVKDAARDLLIKMVEFGESLKNPLGAINTALDVLRDVNMALISFAGVGLGVAVVDRIAEFIASETPEAAYEEFKARIAELEDELTAMFPSNVLDNLSASGVDMVLNVYGSEDLLAKDLKINGVAFGGYRDNIGGYTTLDRNKTLINVEIAGATHFDYMRRGDWISNINNVINPADEQWNREVADFVARLVANSKTIDSVNAYMAELKKIELAEFKNNRWIVSLPGSGLRTQNGAQ